MRSLQRAGIMILFALYAGAAAGTEVMLFYTPHERARITAERSGMLARDAGVVQSGNLAATESTSAANSDAPRLEGVSLPREGRAHAWIGGRRYQDGAQFQGQRMRVVRNGVQLMAAGGSIRFYRVGEAIRGAAAR